MPKLDRMKLNVRGVERDFYFRRDSSDGRVISQIFHENDYDLQRLRRFQQVVDVITREGARGRRPLIAIDPLLRCSVARTAWQ
jgi:hypothetical protein